MLPALFLLFATATFTPEKPTVGDVITVNFTRPVVLEPSRDYEVVRREGTRLFVRKFDPKPLIISGTSDGEFFRVEIPISSVLTPSDPMKPAPLRPPRPLRQPRMPLIAIAVAGVVALAVWAAALLLNARANAAQKAATLSAADQFRARIAALRKRPGNQPWAALADATRAYLTSLGYGAELTTSQLIRNLDHLSIPAAHGSSEAVRSTIAEVLHQGDFEKFSPWGAPSGDFAAVASHALALPDIFEPPAEAAAEEAA